MDFHKKIHSDRHRPTPVFIIACFFSTVKLFCGISGKWGGVFGKKAKKNEPQATAVELAQLGEVDDSPQCGEMSRRDKRARHPLKMGDKLSPLTKVLIRWY